MAPTRTSADRLDAIHEILAGRSEGAGTSELLTALSERQIHISQKTLQRDLKVLLEKGQISQRGKAKSTVYFLSRLSALLTPMDLEPYFRTPYETREITERFDFGVFGALAESVFTPAEVEQLAAQHRDFRQRFARYDSQTIINKEYERILIEFSWKSSQIEGNTYSLLSTERLIRDRVPEAGKTREETQMILNHKDIFNEVLQNKGFLAALSRAKIEHIHSVLTRELGIPRNIRNAPVGITGTRYRPLDNAHQITEAMDAMTQLINAKENVFEKAFLVLVLLSYIQAFEDGNKRTARMTANAILLAHDALPISYRAVDEVEYKKASLLFYERHNLSYFKQIFIEQYGFAVDNYFL